MTILLVLQALLFILNKQYIYCIFIRLFAKQSIKNIAVSYKKVKSVVPRVVSPFDSLKYMLSLFQVL